MKINSSDAALSYAGRFLLLALFLTAWATPSLSHAQAPAKSQLTPKYLIGDAVSLSNKSYPEVDKAIQRAGNGDFIGAQEFLEKAKEKYPKLAPSDVMMAKIQLLARNVRAVQFYLERAATQHPEDPEAYLMLADQAFAGQRTTEALSLFEYAAPLVEKFTANTKRKRNFNIRVLAGRAAVAERRRQWEQASKLLQQWIDVDPENAMAHTRMGIVMFRLDKAKESLAEFSKAREINPDVPHPFVSLGQLFQSNGESEKARKSFEKAYSENPSDPKIAQSYAEWLIQQAELEKAQEIASTLREQTPDSINALLLDGVVAYMQGQAERAEQTLQKVLSLDPRNARATDLMALLLIKSEKDGDKERALQYAQNNAERLANNAQANVTRAYVLYELGRKAEAQKSLQQAGKMQIRPDSTFLIAKILVAEGQNEKAIAALEKIINQKSGLIIFRRDAEELLAKLKGSSSESK
ncbi:MAG: tetratricopeptide repeat protein [Planctomycetes bacterium]|nr:tetratricopeptide repeat protein [Planctomycetota bacterium]